MIEGIDKMWPIYIPSKGRPESKLFQALPMAVIVVEPQDYESYRKANPQHAMEILPENDKGIAFVRNYIKRIATEKNQPWYWMLDDDVTGLFETEGKKTVRKDHLEVLAKAESDAIRLGYDVGIVALEYQQFAWSTGGKVVNSGYCDVVVAINTEHTALIRYRDEMVLKEDRDFVLQVLASGMPIARLTRYSFACPKNGANKGGLHDLYAEKTRERIAVDRMCEAWGPEVCKPNTKKDGRYDVKINWRHFKN